MPIRQQGCARLWANDKAAAGLSLMKPAPFPPNRNNSGQRKAPSSSKAKCNGSFFISLNISPSQGAKALKGQPEWLVADRNAIKVKKGSTSLHVIYCLFYMGAQREQARDGLSLSPQP